MPGDEVNQKVLVKWVIQHWEFNSSKQISKNEIEEIILRLCSLGFLAQKIVRTAPICLRMRRTLKERR